MSVRIVHLSDFHLSGKPAAKANSQARIVYLTDSLAAINDESPIHLIIFTGDLLDAGGNSFANMDEGFASFKDMVIDPICARIGLSQNNFVIVPGNHDTDSYDTVNWRNKRNIVDDYHMTTEAEINLVMDGCNEVDKDIICKRTGAFKQFEQSLYNNGDSFQYYPGAFESNFVYVINGIRVGITAANTVWLYGATDGDHTKENIVYLGTNQLRRSHQWMKNCDLAVFASHFNHNMLLDVEKNVSDEILAKDYSLLLSGHVHSSKCAFVAPSTGGFYLDVISSGTLDGNVYEKDPEYMNSFQVIDYEDQNHISVTKYKQQAGSTFTQYGRTWNSPYNEEAAKIAEEQRMQFWAKVKNELFYQDIKPFLTIGDAINADTETFSSGRLMRSKSVDKCIESIRNKNVKSLRIMALSGMGKTRLVGEALKDFQNVFYSFTSDGVENGIREILRKCNNGFIVIDDCPFNDWQKAEQIVRDSGKDFKIISLINILTNQEKGARNECVYYLDSDDNTDVITGLLDDARIEDVEIRHKIIDYSGGITLMAKALIQVYLQEKDIRLSPEKKDWLNKLVNPSGDMPADRRSAINAMAAFNPLGKEGPVEDEFNFVKGNIAIHHIIAPQDNVDECFRQALHDFGGRRLIYKSANCINIRPRPLAEWLTEDWLANTPEENWPVIIQKLDEEKNLGDRLCEALKNRLQPMQSEEAQNICKRLNERPFHDEKIILSPSGSQIIFSMSIVSPGAVAENLFTFFEEKSEEFLRNRVTNDVRRNIVWALENAYVDDTAFFNCTCLLGLLAHAENESISNNATGIFLEKFRIVLSGSRAPYSEKERVLDYFYSKGEDYYSLVAKAAMSAFETRSLVHMSTYAEQKRNIQLDNTVDGAALRLYWPHCKDLLIKMSGNKEVFKIVFEQLPNHVPDFFQLGMSSTLYELIDHFYPISNDEWDNMRKGFLWIKQYRKPMYEVNKEKIDKYIDDILAPKKFKSKVLFEIESVDRREFGSDDISKAYSEALKPLAKEFIENKLYETDELIDLADDTDFRGFWLVIPITEIMKELHCQKAVFDSLVNYIQTKPKDYFSSFIIDIIIHSKDNPYIEEVAGIFLSKGYYDVAFSIMGAIDDESHRKLASIIKLIDEGKCPSLLINRYLRYYSYNTIENIFAISELLFANQKVDRNKVAYNYLLRHFGFSSKNLLGTPYLSTFEQYLLQFDFANSEPHDTQEVIDSIEDILKAGDEKEFAIKVNRLVIDCIERSQHFFHSQFDRIYFALLPKYQDQILDEVIDALAKPLGESKFYLAMYQDLGSGFGYGRGPLFQCDEERLKKACLEYSDRLPSLFASMCPVCNYDEKGNQAGLSDFFMWLVDNYGNEDSVLNALSSNFGTYSYTGVGSMQGYYEHRGNLFKPLFEHSNAKVVKWAKEMADYENQSAMIEYNADEYRRMAND